MFPRPSGLILCSCVANHANNNARKEKLVYLEPKQTWNVGWCSIGLLQLRV